MAQQWNPDVDCDGCRAESRMNWLIENRDMKKQDAKQKVMSEFPHNFQSRGYAATKENAVGNQNWDPNADCDGRRAESRMIWLMENRGMKKQDAKQKVMSEFANKFHSRGYVAQGEVAAGRSLGKGCEDGCRPARSTSQICKMGYGRPVAPAKNGRKFETCCRGCALGKDHDDMCIRGLCTGRSIPRIGVGLSLQFQNKKLDLDVAAQHLANMGVRSVRMWSYDRNYLEALWVAGIHDVLVNVPTHELGALAAEDHPNRKADQVVEVVRPFVRQGMHIRIGIANEPLASWENHGNKNAKWLPKAMENMLAALEKEGLNTVTITVPFFNGILNTSWPPEDGAFGDKYLKTVSRVAEILHTTGGEFTIHLYPWFAWKSNPKDVELELALGKKQNVVHGKQYSCLLHQQIAAVRAALMKINPDYATMPLTIGETGWPSSGHTEATVRNARDYAHSVIRNSLSTDLPMDSHLRSIYLFEAFDEQGKSTAGHGGTGAVDENHFGLCFESGEPKFPLRFG